MWGPSEIYSWRLVLDTDNSLSADLILNSFKGTAKNQPSYNYSHFYYYFSKYFLLSYFCKRENVTNNFQ